MNGLQLQTDQNQDILKDNSSQGNYSKGQVMSSQSKDNNNSPNDILSAFNQKSSLSKINQELLNSSYNPISNSSSQQLADILFYCRKRLDEGSIEYLTKVIPLDYEKEEMEQIDTTELTQYIKQIIIYLSKCKLEMTTKMLQVIKPDEEYMNEYEGMLQKAEAECRNHIRIEQQLKIYAETAQEKLEFAERDLETLEKQNEELKVQLSNMTKTNEELINLNQQRDEKIEQLKKKVKELEEQLEKQNVQIQQNSSSQNKTSKIPLHSNNKGSIRDSIDYNLSQNGPNYIEQNNSGGFYPQNSGNSHKNNENCQQSSPQSQQIKRMKRSVSTLNSGNQEEAPKTQREVMKQLENNAFDKSSNRIKTEPYQNLHQSGSNSNVQKLASSSQNIQSNTYSQDALNYLLGNSSNKPSSSSSQNRSTGNTKEDKRVMDKYLFDKGDKALLKKIYGGDSAKSRSFVDSNKSQKNQNTSRGPSSQGQKGSQGSIGQNQQQQLVKQLQQQQIMKQVQSQAVLNRIQQKISSTILNNGSSKNSYNGNNSSNNLSNLLSNNNNNLFSQSQTQRAISRSKSRNKLKEGSDTSRNVKEYNIYTLNSQNGNKNQQVKASPLKQKAETHRSYSLDAYSKVNTKQQVNNNLK